jgi:steroid delta-isomerase-like uncharacterized protein
MSAEANKAVMRRFIEEAWNRGNMDVIDELLAPDFDSHPVPSDMPAAPGREGQKQVITAYRNAFDGTRLEIEDQIAEGDRVVTRWTARGRHTGDLMGMPPSGRDVSVSGVFINRVVNGKIVEGWGNFDALGMLQQIGALPIQREVGR